MSDNEFRPPVGPVDPDHPECAAVIAEVWTLLDGECSSESRDKLKHHLEECPACLRHYGVEERVKRLIATRCSGEKAPDTLTCHDELQFQIVHQAHELYMKLIEHELRFTCELLASGGGQLVHLLVGAAVLRDVLAADEAVLLKPLQRDIDLPDIG